MYRVVVRSSNAHVVPTKLGTCDVDPATAAGVCGKRLIGRSGVLELPRPFRWLVLNGRGEGNNTAFGGDVTIPGPRHTHGSVASRQQGCVPGHGSLASVRVSRPK